MGTILLITLVAVTSANFCKANIDLTQNQLLEYKNSTQGNVTILTTSNGVPVSTQYVQSINTDLLYNDYFLDFMTHFMRERIPERIVHAKGAAAFGELLVTNDLSSITKAPHLGRPGTRVPVAIRFSGSFTQTGGSDVARENRGFAVKFYTNTGGNYDYLFLTTEMFAIKDPIHFPDFSKVYRDSPVTGVVDSNARWDFHCKNPSSLNAQTRIFGDIGIPDGFRFMPGSCIHTFEMLNKTGNITYVRLHMFPDAGIKTLTESQARKIQATDLHYARRDLYNAIATGNYPKWTLYVQIISQADRTKAGFDIFDVTKLWPVKKYPLTTIGTIELNRNPTNHFAEVEQLTFNPASLFPGVRGVDTLFKARALLYKDAQNYRVGPNHAKIAVNCPLSFNNYNRDGSPPVKSNGGNSPFYSPNSFNGPVPYSDSDPPRTVVNTEPGATNYDQLNEYYEELTEDQKCRLIDNIVTDLSKAADFIQKCVVDIYKQVNVELGSKIESGIVYNNATCPYN